MNLAPPTLKTIGYLVSAVSVILLGIVSWKAAKHDALLVAALAGGIVLSMTGMFLRWLSYELERNGPETNFQRRGGGWRG